MRSYREDVEQRLISEQAAAWLCDLDEANAERRAEFAAWLKRSPRHVGEFLMAAAAWREFDRSGLFEDQEIENMVADALAGEGGTSVVPLPGVVETSVKPRRRARWRVQFTAGIAAAVAAVALGTVLIVRWIEVDANTYATSVGEQRTLRLTDGSLVHLNTHSRVIVQFSEHSRDIRLTEGEALFNVEHDPTRPFRVDVDGTLVQAIGTQFDVYRREPTGTTVLVVEGVVEIAPAGSAVTRLAAGERADIRSGGTVVKRAAADVGKALAWRERRLVFEDERLEEIVAEVNRYTSRRVRVDGETARNKRITGTFDAEDPQSLVLFLGKLEDLRVDADGEEFIVQDRQASVQ